MLSQPALIFSKQDFDKMQDSYRSAIDNALVLASHNDYVHVHVHRFSEDLVFFHSKTHVLKGPFSFFWTVARTNLQVFGRVVAVVLLQKWEYYIIQSPLD